MIVGRIVGWLLLIAAGVTLLADIIGWYHTGFFKLSAAGELWFRLDRGSLNLVQAVIQRYVAAWLWDPVIQTVLQFYALLVLGVPGLVLVWAFRSREARRRQAKSSQIRAD
jgi:hypothetical protein